MINYKDFKNIIHEEGRFIISAGLIITFIFMLFGSNLAWLSGLFTLFSGYFFRNPIRFVPVDHGLIVAPADGIICDIKEVEVSLPSSVLNRTGQQDNKIKMNKISIFLSVVDVHVNRIPIESEVIHTIYHHGAFFNASLDKANKNNEKMSTYLMVKDGGHLILVDQIAGFIARRIINNCQVDTIKQTGEEMGIIKFGSRVDLYLPIHLPILVHLGQTSVGGETIISSLTENKKIVNGVREM